jgi:hypothetical protein
MNTQHRKPRATDVLLTFRKITSNVARMENTLLELLEHPDAPDSMVMDSVRRYRTCAAGARESARQTLDVATRMGYSSGLSNWAVVAEDARKFLRRRVRS